MEKRRGSPLRRAVLFRFMRRSVCRNRSRMRERPVAGPDGSEVSVSVRGTLPLRLFPPPAASPPVVAFVSRRFCRCFSGLLFCCRLSQCFPAVFHVGSLSAGLVAAFSDRLSGLLSFCRGLSQCFPIVFPAGCLSGGGCLSVFRSSFRPPFRASFPGGTGGNRADAVRRVGRLLRPRGKRAFRRLPAERRYSAIRVFR